MSVVDKLLAAQARPPTEARRLVDAVTASLRTGDGAPGSAAAAEKAALSVAQVIADAKLPKPPPPAGHAALFADDTDTVVEPQITDAPPVEPNVRCDPYFLPDDPKPASVAEPEEGRTATPEHPQRHRSPGLLIAAAGAAAVAALAVHFTGGEPAAPSTPAVSAPGDVRASASPASGPVARLVPGTVSASCGDPRLAFDGDRSTVWSCADMRGAVLNMTFSSPVTVTDLGVAQPDTLPAPPRSMWRLGGQRYGSDGLSLRLPHPVTVTQMSLTLDAGSGIGEVVVSGVAAG